MYHIIISSCFTCWITFLTQLIPPTFTLWPVDTLGGRLECERTEKRCLQACLCYICSGNIEKLVECWALHRDCSSPLGLEVLSILGLLKALQEIGHILLHCLHKNEKYVWFLHSLISLESLFGRFWITFDVCQKDHALLRDYKCKTTRVSLHIKVVAVTVTRFWFSFCIFFRIWLKK